MWPDAATTQVLLQDARGGDEQAVNELLERHRGSLRRLVQLRLDQKVQRRVDVSDVVQEALVEASRRLRDYLERPGMAFHLWLRQIARDRIIDAHRRHRASARRSVDREQDAAAPSPDHSTYQLAAQLCDPELTPASAAAQQELARRVEEAIAHLPEGDREVILMRHYEQLSNQEIAQALGLTEPAASMRYLRAVRRLRAALAGERDDAE